jgi:hypothetical protein
MRSAYTPLRLLQLYPHTPTLHTALAPDIAFGQVLPQPLQFVTVPSGVSQPFCGPPSQLPQPLLQVGAQAPLAQLVVPCWLLQT